MPVTICADDHGVAVEAASRLTTLIETAIHTRRSAVVCLTGGSTPKRLYTLLGDASASWRSRVDWRAVHVFWGDERHVPPDHEDSNYGMARAALLEHVPIPEAQIHRMRGEMPDADDAARDYEQRLRAGFARAGRDDLRFDVMLLGLGEDAHIASLFPGSELLARRLATGRPASRDEPRVAAVWAAHLNAWRVTLTPAALLDADAILMIVAGAKKAGAVRLALHAPFDVARYPAHLLRDAGERVEWIVDSAANGAD
jgi:6-phosphogluconolactonase